MPTNNHAMKTYMEQIGSFSLITKAEEGELAGLIAQGNRDARAKLIRSNLRLVVKIAHDFKGLGLPIQDLISEGNIGLITAVGKFDPAKGAKLSSYAAWWIKQAMRRALAKQSKVIRIPIQSAEKIVRIQTARKKLTKQLGRDPTDAEIAKETGLTERSVVGFKSVHFRSNTISIDNPGEEFGDDNPLPISSSKDNPLQLIEGAENLRQMRGLLEQVSEREKTVLTLRFGLNGEGPMTLQEVSQVIGRSRERVRQIQNEALGKLRQMMEEDPISV